MEEIGGDESIIFDIYHLIEELKEKDINNKPEELEMFIDAERYQWAWKEYDREVSEAFKYIIEIINSKFENDIIPTTNLDDMKYWKVKHSTKPIQYTTNGISKQTFSFYYNNSQKMFEVELTIEEKSDNIKAVIEIETIADILKEQLVKEVEVKKEFKSTAGQLQGVVSQWYFILRNLALLVLMLFLIYSGIRIVIGSTAGEKAKYKERIMDWLTGICLVFIMHYIMVFALEINQKIIELVQSMVKQDIVINSIELGDQQIKNIEKMEEAEENGETSDVVTEQYTKFKELGVVDDNNFLHWTTDLIGSFRVEAQKVNEGTAKWVGYSLCYLILVLQTVFFTWAYIKRVLYMAFLTIIAPLVAMTYPVDKLTDGKAQAFGSWLKEYIFNLLIQPMHLVLYLVLVSSAWLLATTNAIYSIVAIGFIMPAEKLLRKFFGFEKAKTPGLLGGAAGAALAFTGLQKIMNTGQRRNKKQAQSKDKDTKIRMKSSKENDPFKAIAGGKTATAITNKTEVDKKGKNAEKNTLMNSKDKSVQTGKNKPEAKSGELTNKKSITTPTKPNETAKKKTFIRRAATTGKNMRKAYFRMLGQKAKRSIKNGRPVRALARGATGALGATAFGMTGLALGVAGGDPTKAAQYASAGVIGGYQAGKGVAGSVVDTFSVDKQKIKDEAEMSWYGSEYKQHMLDKSKEDLIKDEKSIDHIRKLTGVDRDEAQEILRTTGGACLEAGITDIDDIAAIHEMTNGKDAISMEEAIAAQQFNQFLPSELNKMGVEERNQHILRWAKEFEKQGYEDPYGLAGKAMKYAERFNRTKSGMKKVKTEEV